MLSGSNQMAGSAGYAGVYAAVGATLTISGDGSLNAKGDDGSKLTNFDGFGCQRIYWGGGAGIGGGDNGGVTSITISGGTVVARATSAAAGIGAGNSGELGGGVITLTGAADVTAYGGSHPTRSEGGVGIGSGRSYDYDSGFESITISGQAKVRVHDGKNAQSLGVGTYYGGDSVTLPTRSSSAPPKRPLFWSIRTNP